MNLPAPSYSTLATLCAVLSASLSITLLALANFRSLWLKTDQARSLDRETIDSLRRASSALHQEHANTSLELNLLRNQATSIIAALDSLHSRLSEPSISSRLPHRFFNSFASLISAIEPIRTPPPGPPLDILPKPPPS